MIEISPVTDAHALAAARALVRALVRHAIAEARALEYGSHRSNA